MVVAVPEAMFPKASSDQVWVRGSGLGVVIESFAVFSVPRWNSVSRFAEIMLIEEYRAEKAKLLETKRHRQDELAQLAKTKESWFEPAVRFVKAAIEATILAESENDIAKRDFLKKHGSNLFLRNKELSFEARGAWKTVVNPGRLAHHENAAPNFGAASCGKSDQDLTMRRR